MALEAAFLEDIARHPDDDVPRLIFADWLEDHGDPDRAEFIRVQCECARLEGAVDRDAERRRKALRHRERQLRAKHRKRWAEGLEGAVEGYGFRRGLLEVVWLDPQQLIEHGGRLADCPPTVREVRVERSHFPLDPGDLLSSPHLWWVTHLDLSWLDLTAGHLRRLCDSPRLGRLRALHLRGNRIGPEAAGWLANAPGLPELTELGLDHNDVGGAGAEALAAAPGSRRLTRLSLRRNGVSDAGARALAASPHLGRLESLDLNWNPAVGPEGAALLRARFGDAVWLTGH